MLLQGMIWNILIFLGFHYFFGVAIAIFEGNWAALDIESSMEKPAYFHTISVLSILFVVVLNISISAVSYYTFGADIRDIILSNLEGNMMSKVVQISYGVGLLATTPIQMAPVFETLSNISYFDNFIRRFTSKTSLY